MCNIQLKSWCKMYGLKIFKQSTTFKISIYLLPTQQYIVRRPGNNFPSQNGSRSQFHPFGGVVVFCNKVWHLQCGETKHVGIDFLLKNLMLTRYLYIFLFSKNSSMLLKAYFPCGGDYSNSAYGIGSLHCLLRGILKITQLVERMVVELVQTWMFDLESLLYSQFLFWFYDP